MAVTLGGIGTHDTKILVLASDRAKQLRAYPTEPRKRFGRGS